MKFDRKQLFTIPNILTYIRIVCVPIFIWLMLDKSIAHNVYIAFGLFMFASFTDMVDGFVARHFHLISDIGKVLDPIADKMLQVSTLVCLTIIGKIHWAFPLVFFLKETYMVLGSSVIIKIIKSEYVIQSNIFGKGATWLNSLGILLGFFAKEVNSAYDTAVFVILTIGAVFAIITAIIYTIEFFKFRKNELAQKAASEVQKPAENENVEVLASVADDDTKDAVNND